jgi:hypothetical protein
MVGIGGIKTRCRATQANNKQNIAAKGVCVFFRSDRSEGTKERKPSSSEAFWSGK